MLLHKCHCARTNRLAAKRLLDLGNPISHCAASHRHPDGRGIGKAGVMALGLGIGAAVAFSQPSLAREPGAGLEDLPGGGTFGSSADNIPVGIFMVDQFFTRQLETTVGPGAPFLTTAGKAPNVKVFVNAEVFIFNPGWSFLGGTTQFVIAQPFVEVDTGNNPGPLGGTSVGVNDTLFSAQAAWKFGDFHIKTDLGAWAPTGTQQGPAGLNNAGLPFWTVQPELVLSWEPSNWLWGANWNFTAYTYWELATKNQVTNYQSAPIFHSDFTATATWGKWTVGPVASYFTQVGHDSSSSYYAAGIGPGGTCVAPIGFQCLGTSNLEQWEVGGLLQYNFGPVTLQLWATDIVFAKANGSTPGVQLINGTPFALDKSADNRGYTIWFQASYALWTPPELPAAPKAPLIYK
jgi:hypothetical protein